MLYVQFIYDVQHGVIWSVHEIRLTSVVLNQMQTSVNNNVKDVLRMSEHPRLINYNTDVPYVETWEGSMKPLFSILFLLFD